MKLAAKAELVDKNQEIAIGTADEVVEPLNRVALEAEGLARPPKSGAASSRTTR